MKKKALSSYSYQDYLDLEKDPEIRYECHNGFIVAMAGGTPQHGLITMNFSSELHSKFEIYGDGLFYVQQRCESSHRTNQQDILSGYLCSL